MESLALHARLAILETELEHARSEKNAADQATQYLLRLTAKFHGAELFSGLNGPDVAMENRKLLQELNRLKEENLELRRISNRVALLWADEVRLRKGHQILEPSPKVEADCLNLIDLDVPMDHVPELEYSDVESLISEHEHDSVHDHTSNLPRIDFCSKTVSKEPLSLNSGANYLHRFTSRPQESPREANILVKLPGGPGKLPDGPEMACGQGSALKFSPQCHGQLNPETSVPKPISPQDITYEYVESQAELRNSIEINQRCAGPEDLTFPNFFRFGIQYRPSPNERNVFRTISIMNLPSETSRANLLRKIRGGALVSAVILDTASITGGSFSALITFIHEKDARAFEAFAAASPISFDKQKAHVKLLPTPTRPLSNPLNRAIFTPNNTRCLEIHNFPGNISLAVLRQHLRVHPTMTGDAIVELEMRSDNTVFVAFMSLFAARKAHEILARSECYGQCRVVYARDPCSFPGEMLRESGEVRGDMMEN